MVLGTKDLIRLGNDACPIEKKKKRVKEKITIVITIASHLWSLQEEVDLR